MAQLKLSDVYIYPVKSFAGLSLNCVEIDRFGPVGDRRWMLVDEFAAAITQRGHPKLALIETELAPNGLILRLGSDCIEVAVPDSVQRGSLVKVWADEVVAVDCGDEVASWLRQHLAVTCRLVYMPRDSIRRVDSNYAQRGETVGFADAFPLLLISQASLDDLNSRLQNPVPMNRFRPNLVVDGCEPFAEDSWKKIRIGAMEFDLVKPCDRCVMPSIDQRTGEKDLLINRVLASYRRREGKIYFGQNLLYEGEGAVHVGSQVEVLE